MADADNVINYINNILNTSTKTKFNITTLYNNYKTNNNIDKIHFKNVLDRNYKLDANKQNIIIKTNSDIDRSNLFINSLSLLLLIFIKYVD